VRALITQPTAGLTLPSGQEAGRPARPPLPPS
jgi:hypothetical protein